MPDMVSNWQLHPSPELSSTVARAVNPQHQPLLSSHSDLLQGHDVLLDGAQQQSLPLWCDRHEVGASYIRQLCHLHSKS